MISIIIPCYNAHNMTEDCISAVIKNTADPFEIVLIDNGSTPPYSIEAVHGHGVVIRNESNTGFPCAVNQGIRKSSGEIIILLNNDVFVTPGWASRLAAWLEKFSIVGPVTNYCAGAQMTTIGCYENLNELNERAVEWTQENEGDAKDVNFIIGLCFAFRRSLFDEIGPFDETLWPCSGEEIDFCFRAREAGHRIGVARDVYVHHEGSQTFNDMQKTGQINYVEMAVRNDKHLAKKWGWGFWKRQEIT